MTLHDYGFSPFFAEALSPAVPGQEPGRVIAVRGPSHRVITESREIEVTVAGKLRHLASSSAELPAIGDWVVVAGERIQRVLPRRTKLSRKVPGARTREQVVAANVDTVLIVMGLDADFSERRIERYVTTITESGAEPAIVLNKVDVAPDRATTQRATIAALAQGAPVILTSCYQGLGLDDVRALLRPRQTAVLVGSSGVGKSTLVNLLQGEALQATRVVSPRDDRGQHTTSHRELFRLAGGALLIDNPGMRELQLWVDDDTLNQTFDDIARLADGCRYRNCTHGNEPGCAVTDAVDAGTLGAPRVESFRALQRELAYLHRRQDESAGRAERQKWRTIHKEMRRSGRHRRT